MSKKRDKKGRYTKGEGEAKGRYVSEGNIVKRAEALENLDQVVLEQTSRQDVQLAANEDGEQGAARPKPDPADPSQVAEQFPTRFLQQHDKRDRINMLKHDLQIAPGVTPYGQLTWSDDIGDWLLRKEQAAKKADFQQWFATQYDHWGPAQKKIARQLYPQFYAERMRTTEENLELLKKLIRVRLMGVQNAEDLAIQYAAEKGLIDTTLLATLLHPEEYTGSNRFKAGLFNYNTRYMGQDVNSEEHSEWYSGVNTKGSGSSVPSGMMGAGTVNARNSKVLQDMGFFPRGSGTPAQAGVVPMQTEAV